ncbi:MAG TPA: DUF4007 family protein, partial [Thermomicrobiaceae bacterium]|nr:DUF4007 family protein [Thermomicrobiaceae bacterium]
MKAERQEVLPGAVGVTPNSSTGTKSESSRSRRGAGAPARYGFTGHQTFPFRYGWLKKAVDAVRGDPGFFRRGDALVELGVGKNMVESIRHWGLATQVLTESDRGRVLAVSDDWG